MTIVFVIKQFVHKGLLSKKTYSCYLVFSLLGLPSIAFTATSDSCSTTWSLVGGEYQSTTPNGTVISVNSSAVAPALWQFSPNGSFNTAGVFSDPTMPGAAAFVFNARWDTTPDDGRYELAQTDAGTGTLTFSFNHRVIDPVLHIDRLGGWGGNFNASPQTLSNSAVITANALSAGVSFERLGGVDHFIVTPNAINRELDQPLDYYTVNSESGVNGTTNTASGSVKVAGRFSDLNLDFTGGGVEGAGFDGIEFVVCSFPYDLSDAPINGVSPNGVSVNAYGEAAHAIQAGVYMGASLPDNEFEPQTSALADGDDNDGNNDDDGITGLESLVRSKTTTLTASVSGAGGYLQAWIDFDGNGQFDSAEQIASDIQDGGALDTDGLVNGQIAFEVQVPKAAIVEKTFARFRWSTSSGLDAVTSAGDGEVEDYQLSVQGVTITGRVFNDSNVDGLNDSAEKGLSDLPVVLRDVLNNVCVSARTNAEGNYAFFPVVSGDYQIYEASKESVPTPAQCDTSKAKDPAAYVSTTSNVLDAFTVTNQDIHGKDFGDALKPLFKPDNSGTVLPDNVIFYTHQFTAQSSGKLSFSVNSQSGATPGWSSTLYQDANCNNQMDAGEGNAPVSGVTSVVAGDVVCLLNKVYAPSNVIAGEKYTTEITAVLDFENSFAGTKSLVVIDRTKAAAQASTGVSRLELKKTVENTTQGTPETETLNQAKPGDVLKYRVYYSNTGTAGLSDLVIRDVVPEYTSIVGMPVCDTPLPNTLTSCTPTVSGMDIEWVFPSTDELQGGSSGVVSFEVLVDN